MICKIKCNKNYSCILIQRFLASSEMVLEKNEYLKQLRREESIVNVSESEAASMFPLLSNISNLLNSVDLCSHRAKCKENKLKTKSGLGKVQTPEV